MTIYMSEHEAKEFEENWDAEAEKGHVPVERRKHERVPFRVGVEITVVPAMLEISEDGEYLEFPEDES